MTKRVARNVAWNLAGTLVSLAFGIIAVAVLMRVMGTDRLGVFALALGFIGLSGVLDLGLGRGLTQKVASDLGEGRSGLQIAPVVWCGLQWLAAFGAVISLVIWWLVPWIVNGFFSFDEALADEAVFGLRAMALSVPFALVSTGAVGALEGFQLFPRVSAQRTALSFVQFGLPMLIAWLVPDAGWAISGLVVSRVLGTVVWLRSLSAVLPFTRSRAQRGDIDQLFRFGGWLSVSGIVGPLMVHADRFYLAGLFPPASVAYYAIPLDTLFRSTVLPTTVTAAAFPALAERRGDPEQSTRLLRALVIFLIAMMLPVLMLASTFATPLLSLWLGQEFAVNAGQICRWLLLGMFVNSLAHVPFALLQAHGRADITAKLHLLELPFFATCLVLAVGHFGLVGAALAWVARVALDTVLLYIVSICKFPELRKMLAKGLAWVMLGSAAMTVPIFSVAGPWRIVIALMVCLVCAAVLLVSGNRLRIYALGKGQ